MFFGESCVLLVDSNVRHCQSVNLASYFCLKYKNIYLLHGLLNNNLNNMILSIHEVKFPIFLFFVSLDRLQHILALKGL